MICAAAGCANEVVWSGKGRKAKYCSESCKQKSKRVRENTKRVNQLKEQRQRLYIYPCDLDTANAFVKQLHRHNKDVPGSKINLAVVDETGLLRGVAIIGRPVARHLDDKLTLEVNRVCTDGCPNACSILYAAARKTAFAQGYRRLVTYTLQSESGASLRGSGWQRVSEVKASDNWIKSRVRKSQTVYQSDKWRWETINPDFKNDRPVKMQLPPIIQAPTSAQLDMFQLDMIV